MTLQKKGKYGYGSGPEDLKTELIQYGKRNDYEAVRTAPSECVCGSNIFELETDEDAGAARRVCTRCGAMHLIGDSQDYADEAKLGAHECICGKKAFELLSGVALYDGRNDVRWYCIGCASCNLVGVFADWKCEAGHADLFLSKV